MVTLMVILLCSVLGYLTNMQNTKNPDINSEAGEAVNIKVKIPITVAAIIAFSIKLLLGL